MFRKKVKIKEVKRKHGPFQKGYAKDVGPVFTFYTAIIMFILVLGFCLIVYGIIDAIRMI